MKKLLLFLCLLVHIGFAGTPRIDSLKRELGRLDKQPNGYTKDTLRYQALKAIMIAYVDVNIDSSAHYNALIFKLCKNPDLQKELIYAYQFSGYLYQIRGDYHQSIRFYYKSLPLAEKLKQYPRMVTSQAGLAHAYVSLKNYAKATKLCREGLAILQKYPDAYAQLLLLNVLEGVYQEQGKLADALKVSKDMYKLARSERKPWYEAQALHLIGWIYMKLGDRHKALDYYGRALTLVRKVGSINLVGSVDLEESILLHIADIYTQQKKWPKALAYCNLAQQTAIRLKNSSIVAEAYEKLYKIFRQTHEPAKALKAYENFVLLKDSLSKEKNQQRIETLQAQYDNVQKTNALQKQQVQLLAQQNQNQQLEQKSNGLLIGAILLVAVLLFWNNRQLQDKNRELIQKNEEIKGALFKGQTIERKRVALELHDNLSSLLSAVNMSIQSINPQNLSESEQSVYRNVKHLIQNAYAEVRNISHNILPAELEREGLATTLTTLVGQLNQNSPLQFLLTITGLQEERLPVEIEFNAYSIVLELINNAIKHAKATTVGINLLRTNDGIHLSVTDDGVGLGQNRDKRGVGLQNIQTRLESLGGTFNTILTVEQGTRIHIKIPIETVRVNGNIPMA